MAENIIVWCKVSKCRKNKLQTECYFFLPYFGCIGRIEKKNFLWLFHGWKTVLGREGLWFVCLSYDGNSRRLNRKWFYGEAGNRTYDPWITRHSAYPLHHWTNWMEKVHIHETLKNFTIVEVRIYWVSYYSNRTLKRIPKNDFLRGLDSRDMCRRIVKCVTCVSVKWVATKWVIRGAFFMFAER